MEVAGLVRAEARRRVLYFHDLDSNLSHFVFSSHGIPSEYIDTDRPSIFVVVDSIVLGMIITLREY